MKFALYSAVIGFGTASVVVPEWIESVQTRRDLTEAMEWALAVPTLSMAELETMEGTDGFDVVYAHCSNARGLCPRAFAGVAHDDFSGKIFWTGFIMMAGKLGLEIDSYCGDELARFWVNRPAWFMPTKVDVLKARSCVMAGFEIVKNCPSENLAICNQIAIGSGQIGVAAFSPVVERVIVRKEIAELPSEEGSRGFIAFIKNHPVMMKLLTRAARKFDGKIPREVTHLVENIDQEQIMIQANNFLDHHGHELYALPLWMAMVGKGSDDVVRDAYRARGDLKYIQGLRYTHYFRGQGSDVEQWIGSVGKLLIKLYKSSGSRGKMMMTACFYATRRETVLESTDDLYELLEALSKVNGIGSFDYAYRCILRQVNVDVMNIGHNYKYVPALMHMIKVSYDGFATLAKQ